MQINKKIILYTDKYGYFCRKTKEWLLSRGFQFEEKDVSVAANLQELYNVSGQYAVPVIVCGKNIILGRNEDELNKILLKTD